MLLPSVARSPLGAEYTGRQGERPGARSAATIVPYPGVDQDLLRACRVLMLAMITTWRWDRDDRFPHGRQRGVEWLGQLRAALDRHGRAR